MRESFEAKLLKLVLYTVFILGIIIIATLPFMLDYYIWYFRDAYSIQPTYRTFIMCFLILCGILGLWIVGEMILMMRSISTGPFVLKNVKALKRTGFIALSLAALFILKCCYYITVLTLGCGLLFIICALFAFTLASLFKQAIAYKEENDLTI